MEETPTAADEQDRSLVQRCLAGNHDAAGRLVDKYQQRLFNVALRMVSNAQDAEDITQTVFLNAFRKLDTYDPAFRFFSWIYRMTVNEALNTIKRRKDAVSFDAGFDLPARTSSADRRADSQERIGRALMELKPDDRAVVVLKYFVSFSYQEIADVLEIPVQTVKSRLFTARERLRASLLEQVR